MAADADIEKWLSEIGSDPQLGRRLKVSAARLLLRNPGDCDHRFRLIATT